jgi:hypothetical protein
MSNNEEMNMATDGRLEESLIQLNKLSYQMAPQLGICSARTHTVGFPQQSTYANGETMTWDSQTGAFYVDPVGSYLKFTVTHAVTGGTEGGVLENGFLCILSLETKHSLDVCGFPMQFEQAF